MQRKILFRGKRKDSPHEWIYGDYNVINGQTYIFDHTENAPLNSPDWFEVIPESVGQFWQPSNGLDLYGGDLLQVEASVGSSEKKQMIGLVKECPTGFNVCIWHDESWWAYSYLNFTTAKIIGNITDNPELINS